MVNQESNKEGMRDSLRKALQFFISMKFSMFLLLVIIGVCVAGSIVSSPKEYFRKWWVIALAGILCLNLFLCSVRRLPVSVRNYKRAQKHRIGAFGSWLCHFGMLLIIIGFVAGDFLSKEYVVYGIPGSYQPAGDSGLWIAIDDFDVLLRDDYTVDQYVVSLTVTDEDGRTVSGEASVNHPLSAFGYELYQDSTGWANYVDIYKDEEPMRTDIVCVGEYTYPDDRPDLQVLFNKFYPDLAKAEDGSFYSQTPLLNNPHSLFTVYYQGNIIGMDFTGMGAPVYINEYTFVFRDPCEYTLIVIRRDPTALFVGAAALMMLAGIFLAFYWRPVYPEEEQEQ